MYNLYYNVKILLSLLYYSILQKTLIISTEWLSVHCASALARCTAPSSFSVLMMVLHVYSTSCVYAHIQQCLQTGSSHPDRDCLLVCFVCVCM